MCFFVNSNNWFRKISANCSISLRENYLWNIQDDNWEKMYHPEYSYCNSDIIVFQFTFCCPELCCSFISICCSVCVLTSGADTTLNILSENRLRKNLKTVRITSPVCATSECVRVLAPTIAVIAIWTGCPHTRAVIGYRTSCGDLIR